MPTYKLAYFDGRGIAETTRMVFAVGKTPLEQIRYEPDFEDTSDFKKAKASGELDVAMGKLPYLDVDGVKFGQSKAIERYAAKQLGLMGSSDIEAAQIDAMCECVVDLKKSDADLEKRLEKLTGDDEKKAEVDKFFTEGMPGNLKLIEKSLPAAPGPWLVGNKLSLADVSFYQSLADPKGYFDNMERVKTTWQDCPRIKAAMEAVDANPEMKAYIAGRPDTPW